MSIISDTLRPEIIRVRRELQALMKMRIHIGIQGKADSFTLMVASTHEYGATIRAKPGHNLAIPIDPRAVDKSPRDFPDLFFITSKSGHLFGVTRAEGKEDLNFLFLLLPSVTIPERSFIRGSFDNGRKQLAELCEKAIDIIVMDRKTAEEAANYIGERAAQMTRDYIMAGIDPPKSDITMKTAKTDKPLYNTGRLYESISYEIDDREGEE